MKAARIGRKLAPAAGSWAVRLLAASLRLRRDEKSVESLLAAGAPVICETSLEGVADDIAFLTAKL